MTAGMMASPGSQFFSSVLPEKIPVVGGAGGMIIGRSDSFEQDSGSMLQIGGGGGGGSGGGLSLGMSVLGKQMMGGGGQGMMFG